MPPFLICRPIPTVTDARMRHPGARGVIVLRRGRHDSRVCTSRKPAMAGHSRRDCTQMQKPSHSSIDFKMRRP
jgi:hypothetical protein